MKGLRFAALLLGGVALLAAAGWAVTSHASAEPTDEQATAAVAPAKDAAAAAEEAAPAAEPVEEKAVSERGVGEIGPFTMKPRIPVLEEGDNYPCSDCHEPDSANPERRELVENHEDLKLDHGNGKFWCLACHDLKNRDQLHLIEGELVSFDESYRVCGQCHANRERDVLMGGHGKRIGSWRGERMLTACVECHNPHSPAFKPRAPKAPPKLRKGLARPAHPPLSETPWERAARERGLPVAGASHE